MPNHVYTSMLVTGEPELIKLFTEKHFDKEQFDLSSFAPMPTELKGTTAPNKPPRINGKEVLPNSVEYKAWQANTNRLIEAYGYDNWYEWCLQHWGTKWNTYECDMDTPTENTIACNFQTAWSLPDPIFEKMAKLYPTLEFEMTCVEESGYFSGYISIIEGEVDDSTVTDDEEQWKNLATEILGYEFDEDETD